MPRPENLPILTPDDIERLWQNAADPNDYPALRAHRVSQDGEATVMPAEVVELAGKASKELANQRRRRRGSGPRPDPPGVAFGETIDQLMEMLDIPVDLYTIEPHAVTFDMPPEEAEDYPPLPTGYGFKGGVARKALARTLRLPISTAAVRDIDLLRDAEAPSDHDREVCERYMTEDLILGNAQVEEVVAWRDYTTSRAIVINQLWVLHNQVMITPQALIDTLAGVLRLVQNARGRHLAHPIVAFKLLRFAAHMKLEGREPLILPFRVGFRRRQHPFAFFFALQLSRACESGIEVAEQYLRYVREWGLLSKVGLPDDISVRAAAEDLTERLSEYHLAFPLEQ